MSKTLSYNKALEVVEAWVEREGIRDFCSKFCHGYCCNGCTDSSCLNGIRRIECSIYLCDDLKCAVNIQSQINKHIQKSMGLWNDVNLHIQDKMMRIGIGLLYFFQLPQEVLDKVRFNKSIIMSLDNIKLPKGWEEIAKRSKATTLYNRRNRKCL
jgi:hypothetical protein